MRVVVRQGFYCNTNSLIKLNKIRKHVLLLANLPVENVPVSQLESGRPMSMTIDVDGMATVSCNCKCHSQAFSQCQ